MRRDRLIARRQRPPTLARALKEAAKANLPVRRVRIEADAVVIDVGEPEPTEATNPWLAEINRSTKQ
jgi:hypothetical protein